MLQSNSSTDADRGACSRMKGSYPSDAGIAGSTKGQLPCRLERLEELVWLEKSAQRCCIHQAEGQQQRREAWRGVTIAGGRHWAMRSKAAAVGHEHEQAGRRGWDRQSEGCIWVQSATNLTNGPGRLGRPHQLDACCTRTIVSGVQKMMICSMPFWVFHDRQWPASRLQARLFRARAATTQCKGAERWSVGRR